MTEIRKRKLQWFAGEPEPNIITTQQIQINPREVDFVTSFGRDLQALTNILGISRPIEKANGQQLYTRTVTGELQSGDVPEGGVIPFSQFTVTETPFALITLEKFAKATTIEAVARSGVEASVGMTDEEFKIQLENTVTAKMYNALLTGSLTSQETTWQMALAMAIGRVKDYFDKIGRSATGVAAFVNTLDVYAYLGGAQIQTGTAFGMDYVQNWLGANIVFISSKVPQGRVIATPVNNLLVYYVNPTNSEFTQIGLEYSVDPTLPYIGFHTIGNYSRAQSESYAIMGIEIGFDIASAVAVITVQGSPALGTITVTPSAGTEVGTTKATISGQAGTAGNVLKYKVADAAVPVEYGENVRNWPVFTQSTDIPATAGQYLTVVEADQFYTAVGAGSAVVTVNSGD